MGVPDTETIFLAQAVPPPPDLAGLPGWAQVIGYAVFALSIVGVGLVTRFGWRMGRATPPTPGASEKTAAVAAVIVDPEALNNLTAAALKVNTTLGQLSDLIGQYVADQREERADREFDEAVKKQVKEELAGIVASTTQSPAAPRRPMRPTKS